jgi:hypothetical protein
MPAPISRCRSIPTAIGTGWWSAIPARNVRNFDGQPGISEMDALIAYLADVGHVGRFLDLHT